MPANGFVASPSIACVSLLVLTSAFAAAGGAQDAGPPRSSRATPAPTPGDEGVQAEMARLQGTWTFVSAECEGNPIQFPPDASRENALFSPIFRGDAWLDKRAGKEPVTLYTIKVLPSAEPKQIDLTSVDRTETLAGIYKIDGDTLTLCVTIDRDTPVRPTKFVTKKDLASMLFVYKRK